MKIKFWGVRGSIPVPGPTTLRYGGNTTCIEVRTSDNQLIILDAGTGIYQLAQSLFAEFPLDSHIFNSHTHWDHIQGLPFYIPLFVPGNHVSIYGGFDPVTGRPIDDILSTQLQYRFFPVREVELKAKVAYHTLREHQTVKIGNATITPVLLNHPVLNYGYHIEDSGKSMFFTGDYEIPYNIYKPDDEAYDMYETMLKERQQDLCDSIENVDVLIADSAYTLEEYPMKKGWGHGTFDASIKMGQKAHVKQLVLTHHEPTRSDDELEAVFEEALNRREKLANEPSICLAQEGMVIEL